MTDFESKDVYELIDGILADGIKTEYYDDCTVEDQCIHCGASVNDYDFKNFEDAKNAIVHYPNCPYTLAISMNVRRDYKQFPEVEY